MWAPVVFLLLWSGGFTVAKIGIVDADPLTLLALRYGCVVALIAPLMLVLKPTLPSSYSEWMHTAAVGFFIQVAYFGTAYKAFEAGASAGAVALITSLQPLFVALLMPLLSSEQVSKRSWIGFLFGLLGSVLVIGANLGIQITTFLSLMYATIALLSITVGTVWEKRFGKAQHPLTTSLIHYTVGVAILLPLAFTTENMTINWTTPFVWALGYLVLCNSILAISLLMMMIRKGEATRVSALFFLVPPTSALLAWLIINEPMAPLAWFGMLIAALGVWLVSTRQSNNT